ncbi:MAG: hypothetical protein IJO74_02995 [Clostridia bacterium]|nr:hypothetical protein [Clostridia bacterium]
MELKTTVIAFICPGCGETIVRDINIFSLSGGCDIDCDCGETLNIKVTQNRKVVLSVPCLACPEYHTIRLSSASFFDRELFTVQCPYTALDICYIGHRDKVEKAVSDNKKYLEETFSANKNGEIERDILQEMYDKYDNPMVMNDILLIIRDYITDGAVECGCDNTDKLRIDIARDRVVLACNGCGKSKEIRALTENDVTYMAELDKIVLK